MAAPLIMSGKPQAAPNQFPIGGVDDLMWHDPNGDLKKWQRDTGVSLWGDPEKNSTLSDSTATASMSSVLLLLAGCSPSSFRSYKFFLRKCLKACIQICVISPFLILLSHKVPYFFSFSDERPVRLWMIGEGEEEDLEVALMKCPVPQKKVDGTVSLERLPCVSSNVL